MENQQENTLKFTIPLEGVESEHCAIIVNEGLSKIPKVTNHHVELNNRRAIITTAEPGTLQQAVEVIRDLGYGVSSVSKTIPVLNMTCASCAGSVESMVAVQQGVIKANVNLSDSTLFVEYLPNLIGLQEIQKAVQAIGYDLYITDEDSKQDSIEDIREKNFRQLKFRTIGAGLLSLPVVLIGMFFMDIPYANEISWILSTPVIIWFGKSFYVNAWKQLKNKSANMDSLVALSTGIAYLFSVFNTLYPSYWHTKGLHGHVYFEAATVIIVFILLGKLLEEKAKGKTSTAIKKLMKLQPKFVTVLDSGNQHIQKQITAVKIGDKILVKPGEQIAVDGIVTRGNSYVDESMLSGEPLPVLKKQGVNVYAGTINQKGSFEFLAEKVGNDTFLAQIIQRVQSAQGSKAPVQKLVDRIAKIFVPIVLVIALISFVAWLFAGGENAITQGILSLVTVLIIACPCALGLATPTAIMVGVGQAAEDGILIKDAESLEIAKTVQAIILDKTGTITEGKPKVTNEYWVSENVQWKQIVSTIEKNSEHPLAIAVVDYLQYQENLQFSNFENIAGKGVRADINNVTYFIGKKGLMTENNIALTAEANELAESWSMQSKTVIWFSNQKQVLALFAISDSIKPKSKEAISELKQMGIKVFMLTGDNEGTAKAIAAQSGIDDYKSDVLPEEKADFVKALQNQGLVVAMAGDGINDSAALAQADVSIAMGHGSDIAMEVAKITILSSELNKIPQAIRISGNTVRTIRQNLFWAFIYNLIGIPIAAGILYPINGFMLNPMIAGAAMALSSLSVVSNSLRLKLKK